MIHSSLYAQTLVGPSGFNVCPDDPAAGFIISVDDEDDTFVVVKGDPGGCSQNGGSSMEPLTDPTWLIVTVAESRAVSTSRSDG